MSMLIHLPIFVFYEKNKEEEEVLFLFKILLSIINHILYIFTLDGWVVIKNIYTGISVITFHDLIDDSMAQKTYIERILRFK